MVSGYSEGFVGSSTQLSVRAVKGFTVLELLCCMGLLAILITLAMPVLTEQMQSMQARTVAMTLQSSAMLARARALRTRTPVRLCPGFERCEGPYLTGFQLRAADERILREYTLPSHVQIGNRTGSAAVVGPVTWDAQGVGNRNLTWVICVGARGTPWAVTLNRLGRPRVQRGIGECLATH